MSFLSIVRDIKNIKIQGAQDIAKNSIKAINIILEYYKKETKESLISNLKKAKNVLFTTRPTEPMMRNLLNYVLFDLEKERDVFSVVKLRIKSLEKRFEDVEKKISLYGSKKILNGNIIFTHCHSSNVINILLTAKNLGKKFEVYNTETRPLFQGRKTATELAKAGIPVTHFVDSAARIALKKADLMLIGADAISTEGKVVNKIGSEMFAEIAYKYDVPLYVCTDSLKFDPSSIFGYEEKIEKRKPSEVWPAPPKGVKISNLCFERIKPELITGIISELGIFRPEIFVEEVKSSYPWLI